MLPNDFIWFCVDLIFPYPKKCFIFWWGWGGKSENAILILWKQGILTLSQYMKYRKKHLLYVPLQMLQIAQISTLLFLSHFPNQPVFSKKHCQKHYGPQNWQLLTMKTASIANKFYFLHKFQECDRSSTLTSTLTSTSASTINMIINIAIIICLRHVTAAFPCFQNLWYA